MIINPSKGTSKGGNGVHVGPDAPTDKSVVMWVDTNEVVEPASSVKVYESVIKTDAWIENEDTGILMQSVAIDGIKAKHTAKADHVYTGDESPESFEEFVEAENQFLTLITNGYAVTYDGGITFHIFGDPNTVEIPIIVEVV